MSFYNLQLFLTSFFFFLLLLFKQALSKAKGEKLKKMENKIPLSFSNSLTEAFGSVPVRSPLKYISFLLSGKSFLL